MVEVAQHARRTDLQIIEIQHLSHHFLIISHTNLITLNTKFIDFNANRPAIGNRKQYVRETSLQKSIGHRSMDLLMDLLVDLLTMDLLIMDLFMDLAAGQGTLW